MLEHIERMRALIAQAAAEAQRTARGSGRRLVEVHLDIYGGTDAGRVADLFEQASRGTEAESAHLVINHAGTRYICWNCCGLRFESEDGMCPNCGEDALEIPEEIAFGLRRVVVG